MNYISFLVLLLILGITVFSGVHGAGGVCDKYPTSEFYKLAPCGEAAQEIRARVPRECCTQVTRMDPKCLCVAILSEEAKRLGLGVEPAIAVTIPKRCRIANRPKGYKCGGLLT